MWIDTSSVEMIPRFSLTSRSWSRSSISALIQLALVLTVYVEIGLVYPVQGQTNYSVGANFVTGNWTNTVNGLVQPSILEGQYKEWAASVNITVGDTLLFDYDRGAHTVFRVKTEVAYTACDYSGGTHITDGTPTAYTIQDSDLPTLYFMCNIPGHCQGGQKVMITPVSSGIKTPTSAVPPKQSNAPHELNLSNGVIAIPLLFACYILLTQML